MRRLEIWRYTESKASSPYVLILQNDDLLELPTVIVAPLAPGKTVSEFNTLNPQMTVDNEDYYLLVERLAAVERKYLTDRIGTAQDLDYKLGVALDRLFFGV